MWKAGKQAALTRAIDRSANFCLTRELIPKMVSAG